MSFHRAFYILSLLRIIWFCAMWAVCHGLFVLHLGVIGRLCFVIVALPIIVCILHTVM